MNRVNGQLNLSRSLGDHCYKGNEDKGPHEQLVIPKPDIIVRDRTDKTDFLIIACDGIWDCLKSEEAVELVHNKIDEQKEDVKLATVISDIFDNILAPDVQSSDGKGTDNMTCIIVKFK